MRPVLISALLLCLLGRCTQPAANLPEESVSNLADSSSALTCNLTCPYCGTVTQEKMPADICIIKYKCSHCEREFGPKTGDCCVFCSYGDETCPPMKDSLQ